MNRQIPYLLLVAIVTFADASAATSETATDLVQRALTLALLDESNARDADQAAVDRFGPVQPFGSVLAAEEHHIAALLHHFRELRLAIPEADKRLRAAPSTVSDACRAGAQRERKTVALYEQLLPTIAGHPAIETTFRAIQTSSRDRQLPAFDRCIERTARKGL